MIKLHIPKVTVRRCPYCDKVQIVVKFWDEDSGSYIWVCGVCHKFVEFA